MRRVRAALLALGVLASAAPPGAALTPPARALEERLRASGLEPVAPIPGPLLRGRLAGEGERRVLLFAGCGPGGEPGRAAALAAAADLARTPRRHALELVLCAPGSAGPAAGRVAAETWLAAHPDEGERDAVLAAVHLEPGDRPGPGGAARLVAAAGPRGRRLPPAWLAHAAVAGSRASGARLRVGDLRRPLMAQLLARFARPRVASGAEPFLAAGVPALTLVGGGPPGGWPAPLAAIVRRLDGLAGRPRPDDVYLAMGGRVWGRRDLYWAGLAAFVALVAGGLPGRWRGAGGELRRRRGRRYLPGFLLRMLFLLLLLTTPRAALVLLAPAALLGLVPAGDRRTVLLLRLLAAAPTALFAGYWLAELVAGRVAAWPAAPLRLLLVVAGVLLATAAIGHRDRPAAPPG